MIYQTNNGNMATSTYIVCIRV